MPYDQSLDQKSFTKNWEGENTIVSVNLFSYNEGPKKLQLSRENKTAQGELRFAKLGRLTKEEAEGILPLMQEALAEMERLQLPLLVHGEVTHADIDVFDREKCFIDQVLSPLLNDYPKLKVVFEHITTADAVDFVINSNANIAATITPHHLLLNRNDLLVGGIHPHNYCLPILKRNTHQQALIKAATSGNPKFFFGSDNNSP